MFTKIFSSFPIILIGLIISVFIIVGCGAFERSSNTDVKQTHASVGVNSSGMTVEQENIKTRLERDNIPGAIKHLYLISPYSGQVILYSTVKGKVTSSGKRLQPYETSGPGVDYNRYNTGSNNWVCTNEIIQEDGTFGSSCPYIYWFDSKGIYQQLYITGGEIIVVRDQPMPIKSVTINLEER